MSLAVAVNQTVLDSVVYGEHLIEFSAVHKPELKRSYITVSPDRGVQVKAPSDSTEFLQDFVLRKARWIIKKQKEQVRDLAAPIEFVTGGRIAYLGKQYYLTMTESVEVSNPKLIFSHSKFEMLFDPSKHSTDDLSAALEQFLTDKAQEKLPTRVRYWSKHSLLKPRSIKYQQMKTRWASCGLNNDIKFNIELMKLPMSLIDYVIVHELAHTEHKNHSSEFWATVRRLMPDYQNRHYQLAMKAF